MSALPIPVSVRAGGVSRDYPTIFADFLRLIPHLCPEWTYLGEDDPGIALTELVAYMGDHLHHRVDALLRDLKGSTTVYRHLLVELSEWLGYFARRPTPSATTLTLTLTSAQIAVLPVPAGSLFAADMSETIYFENLAATSVPIGSKVVSFTVVEGRTAAPMLLGLGKGTAFERFNLNVTDVIFNWGDADLVVTVDGIPATHVRWPRDARSTDLVYWVRQRREGGLQLRFGDGTYGQLLRKGAPVVVTYRQGGGPRGRVGKGAISRMVGTLSLAGVPVGLTVTNATRAIGGLPEADIEEIRQNAPAFFRTQDRAVSIEDYEIYAKTTPGVFRVKAVQSGVNGIILYIVPEGAEDGDAVTPELKSAVFATFDKRKMATDVLAVVPADLIPIDVTLDVFAYPNERNSDVRERVRQIFLDEDKGLLSYKVNDLGKFLRQSDMTNVVEDVPGVDYLDILRFTRQPLLVWTAKVGTAFISDAGISITDNTRAQVWTITFLDADRFIVRGTVSGLQVRQGQLNQAYTDDRGELSFTIKEGAGAMAEGDGARISVSRLAWNIRLAAKEFPVAGNVIINVSGGID